MPNEFIIKNGFRSQGNSEVTGSLLVTDSTSVSSFTASNATISGNVTVLGTASINSLIVNQIGYSSGSNQLGDAADDTQTLYGTVVIPTGSLTVSGSVLIRTSGSVASTILGMSTAAGNKVLTIYNGNSDTFPIGTMNFYYGSTPTGLINGLSNALGLRGGYTTGGKIIFASYLTEVMRMTDAGLGIGTTSPTARLQVRGSGTTSATTALLVENSSTSPSLTITDDLNSQFYGNVGVQRTATSSLDVAGTTRISGSFNTATSGSILTVIGSGSAQPIFTVQGSQGELFSITDSLSGSLFSVNDISGLPILEVFSDNTTLIGNYQDPMLITTAKVVQTNSGSFTVYSLPTASYDTAFFEYSIKSGSNARAGTIMAIQLGSTVNFTETTTTDFGDTTPVSFTVIVTGSNMALTGSSTTGSWTIKTIVRSI